MLGLLPSCGDHHCGILLQLSLRDGPAYPPTAAGNYGDLAGKLAQLSASCLPPMVLTRMHTAVHRDSLRRDERIGDERQDGFRDLLRATQPPNRDEFGELPARLLISR